MELIFATHNQNKAFEIQNQLGSTNLKITTLGEMGFNDEIEENALTIEGNASIKSKTIFQQFGKTVFSEDTGLEVEALDGAPGVHTARFAGPKKDANANMNLLLKKLNGVTNRKARFKTVISFIQNGVEKQFEGICNGTIAHFKSGSSGFGYDPIFIPNGYHKTFAEISIDEKTKISHRGIAMGKFIKYLKTL